MPEQEDRTKQELAELARREEVLRERERLADEMEREVQRANYYVRHGEMPRIDRRVAVVQ